MPASPIQWIILAVEGVFAAFLLWFGFVLVTSPLPLRYNVRNVFVRWRATLATVLGLALVVAVFVLMLALASGLERTVANTGDPRNLLVVRKGAPAESSSLITLEQYRIVSFFEGISRDAAGRPLVSADLLALVTLPRRDGKGEANVLVRGVSPQGRELRPQVRLTSGRWFVPGNREVVVSERLARRFANFESGGRFKTGGRELTVVGTMTGGSSAFDSEVWMDADEARRVFDNDMYSSVLIRTENPLAASNLVQRIENEKRLSLAVSPETAYYAAQTMTAKPIRFLGYFLAITMSIGAVFAAMNTLYAAVGARTREIGTLRVLGFRRRSIMAAILLEGILLALVGGVCGLLLALPMQGFTTGTMSFESFSETVIQFRITPAVAAQALVFAAMVGLFGSFLPALRAARLPVIVALKEL